MCLINVCFDMEIELLPLTNRFAVLHQTELSKFIPYRIIIISDDYAKKL